MSLEWSILHTICVWAVVPYIIVSSFMVLIQTSGSVMFHMLYWVCQIYGIFTDWHYSCITSVGLLMLAGDYCLNCHIIFVQSHASICQCSKPRGGSGRNWSIGHPICWTSSTTTVLSVAICIHNTDVENDHFFTPHSFTISRSLYRLCLQRAILLPTICYHKPACQDNSGCIPFSHMTVAIWLELHTFL